MNADAEGDAGQAHHISIIIKALVVAQANTTTLAIRCQRITTRWIRRFLNCHVAYRSVPGRFMEADNRRQQRQISLAQQ